MTLSTLRRSFAALALGLAAALASAPTFAASWTVDKDASSIGFEVQQGDAALTGSFGSWTADINLDPDNIDAATISATIDTGSAATGNSQFDGMLPSPDWFSVEAFPAATFSSDNVTSVGGNAYQAAGTLTIRDISQPVTLDFTLDIDGDTAVAKGTATVERIAYQVGASVSPAQVGESVAITLNLKATR
ncbi:YceI family protein [Roseibium algae]|uniref:YceI family protein n=1 Tax=Roseibium algae TaxID=3123038 RepID=A0ABU8TQZ8_9HYPH